MRKLLVAGVAAVLVFFAVLAHAGAASAVGSSIERIVQYDVDVTVNDDGSALFRELIVYDFGPNARHGIDRVLPTLMGYDDTSDRSYPLTVVTVAAVDASARYSVSDVGRGRTRIRIGAADRTITGSHAYTITYRLDGVVNAQPGDDELYWNVIGDAWSVAIDRAEVRVHVPGGATRIACYAGATRSSDACDLARVDPPADPRLGPIAVFAHEALFPGEGLTVAVAMPDTNGDTLEPQPILVAKSLHEPRSLRDSFALTQLSGGLAAGLAIAFAAAIARLQFLVGRDRRTSGSATDAAFSDQIVHGERVPLHDTTAIPVEFVPPDKLRPAQLGVLRDEVANTNDVSATIVDLAVRGFLRIEEITDGKSIRDYKLVALRGDDQGELLEYERYLIGQIFEKSPEVTLSSLKNKFASAMARTKTLLYENAMANGWFSARPDHVRTIWSLAGFVVLAFGAVVTFLLARGSRYGLVGVPVVAAGLAIMVGARWMPRRTPKGTGVDRRARGFEDFIQNSEKHRAAFAERANIFTEYLPYAVALGATRKWANTLSVLGLPAPETSTWYVGHGPVVWTTFGDRMSTFTSTTASTLTSTPGSSGSSGFSGGSSGGGGGGGGGGSW